LTRRRAVLNPVLPLFYWRGPVPPSTRYCVQSFRAWKDRYARDVVGAAFYHAGPGMEGDRVLREPEQHLRRDLATDAAVHERVVCEKLRRRSYPRVRDRVAQKNALILLSFSVSLASRYRPRFAPAKINGSLFRIYSRVVIRLPARSLDCAMQIFLKKKIYPSCDLTNKISGGMGAGG
jgi:hypothetical protein